MERASVSRLYKERDSHETIMVLKGESSGNQFSVTVPSLSARILAFEGHGLNDRCTLYTILSQCVAKLGGAFGSVVITLDEIRGVSATMAVSRSEQSVAWINGDVIELVALSQHIQLPLYVRVKPTTTDGAHRPTNDTNSLPRAIEEALSDILSSNSEVNPGTSGGDETAQL